MEDPESSSLTSTSTGMAVISFQSGVFGGRWHGDRIVRAGEAIVAHGFKVVRIDMKSLWARSFSLLLFGFILCLSGSVYSATPLLTQYRHTAWSDLDGTPIDARSVAQTQDGYLWIATSDGLLRFDGARFVRIGAWAGSPLPTQRFRSLLSTRDGSLWAGAGQHVIQFQKGRFVDHRITGTAYAMAEDPSGSVWLALVNVPDDQKGVCQIKQGTVHCFGRPDIDLPRANSVNVTPDGTVWMGGDTGLCRWTIGRPADCYLHDFLGPTYGIAGVGAILQTRRGEQWIGIRKAGHPYGIGHLVGGRWLPYVTPEFNGADIDVTSLMEDADECLWIGTYNQGIYRIDHGRTDHFGRVDGLTDDAVSKILQDRDGTVWVATTGGLDAFRKLPVTVFTRREGLPANSASTVVAARDGRVWIGNVPLSALKDGKPIPIPFAQEFEGKQTTAMLEDRQGRIWAGMEDELVVFDGRSIHRVKDRDGKSTGAIMNMTDDGHGGVWAVTAAPRSLLHVNGYQFEKVVVDPDLGAVTLNSRGELLLVYQGGAFGQYRESTTEVSESRTSGSKHEHSANIRSVWPDGMNTGVGPVKILYSIMAESGDTLLGATTEGLLMMRGDTRLILGATHGLPCKAVFDAVRDADRALWLKMPCGLVSITDPELQRWYANPTSRIDYRLLDASDGFRPGYSGFGPDSSLAPDGRIWYANDKIAQVVDPRSAKQRQAPPPVKIEEIMADRVVHESMDRLQFPPRTRDIEIHYTALSFVLPGKVRFKYRLEGRDKDWTDAATRRVAYYTDLDPGVYRFQVIACNSDGVWNEAGAAFGFEVEASFYRTRWFMLACVLISLALLYLAHVTRLRWLAARYRERLAATLAERERIARDLHDTLLQSTEGLVLVVQAASNQMSNTDPARGAIDRALDRAGALIAEGRDRVQELRATGIDRIGLVDELRAIGESFAISHGIAFRLEADGDMLRIEHATLDQVFLILREGLSNAFQHAAARSVELSLNQDDTGLRARIRDDGRGLDIEAVESGRINGHWGIKGMQERARHIGAVLELRSRVGGGTEIELFVPARPSSATAHRRFTWILRSMRLSTRRGRADD